MAEVSHPVFGRYDPELICECDHPRSYHHHMGMSENLMVGTNCMACQCQEFKQKVNLKSSMEQTCLFCDKDNTEKHKVIAENDLFYARWDNFPVTQGHAEIVPKRHIESFFELNTAELEQFYSLLVSVKVSIQEKFYPDGFNVGINEGVAAGRTVHHLHVHIIPRYKGDVPNPRGGVRNIIPEKGDYLKGETSGK